MRRFPEEIPLANSDLQQILVHHVDVLDTLESRFTHLLESGRLASWSTEDVKDAIRLSAEHKQMAMQAIENERLDQALNNIETVIYIMSGFTEDLEMETNGELLN